MMLLIARLLPLYLLIILPSSEGLVCKKCKDNNDLACKELMDETCPAPTGASPKEPACLTHVYKDANKKENVERKCVLKDKAKNYECVPLSTTEEVKCVTCQVDRCNEKMDTKGSAARLAGASLTLLLAIPLLRLF